MTDLNKKLVKQLADEFNNQLSSLPVKVLPNEDIVFDDYLIKKTDSHWELHNISNHFFIAKFYLKSCALIAASYYKEHDFNIVTDIKILDREYNKNKNDSVLFKHCIKETKDFDQKVIFLNRLECSEAGADYFKYKISQLFKRTFV